MDLKEFLSVLRVISTRGAKQPQSMQAFVVKKVSQWTHPHNFVDWLSSVRRKSDLLILADLYLR